MHVPFRPRPNGEATRILPDQPGPRSSVRILHDEDELRAALERATAFEQLLATHARKRAGRYARLSPLGTPEAAADAVVRRVAGDPSDRGPA
jgi:hypothetical protein